MGKFFRDDGESTQQEHEAFDDALFGSLRQNNGSKQIAGRKKIVAQTSPVTMAEAATTPPTISADISARLKNTPEQHLVVGPLVQRLVSLGWDPDQIVFGKKEWHVPKTPSASKSREKGKSCKGFPVDIAVFASVEKARELDYTGLLFLVECKQPDDSTGLNQLDIYLGLEPHVRLGIWANNPDPSANGVFLYRDANGRTHPQKKTVGSLPLPGNPIDQDYEPLIWADLICPSEEILVKELKELLGRIVAQDSKVTRREEQLDQLCNIILLKLDSDRSAKLDPGAQVAFQRRDGIQSTAKAVREQFDAFVARFPDIFTDKNDMKLRFSDDTLAQCVEDLESFNLLGIGPSVVSVAFQVLRSAALKQEEGQYFTPQPVIEAAVRYAGVSAKDLILDPACGTGGFLIESMMEFRRKTEEVKGDLGEISRWAQKALYGIDKDAIAVKLTKAVMQILGDGSAHCARGDSVLTHKWATDYKHLTTEFQDGRFTLIFTNPPFGAPLTIKRSDAVAAGLTIQDGLDGDKIELGLAMFNRCHQLLAENGRLCIVLPETYFFSPSFSFVREWCDARFKPLAVINIPMDAFQGFCRAKTNLYVFQKLPDVSKVKDEQQRAILTAQSTEGDVLFMNPRTCGIYKNGGKRFKVDRHGQRSQDIDNEMLEHVLANKQGKLPPGATKLTIAQVKKKRVLVPTYYDPRWDEAFDSLKYDLGCGEATIGELLNDGLITICGGHGSPGNDQRNGQVPYVKVSDIRSQRVNTNPTNMVPLQLAKKLWRGQSSGLQKWDLVTPNRASSNIGEFAMLLPGEENIVLTKEVFVVRVTKEGSACFDPFYLMWAFSLQAVRNQWRRIALMQTNREDVGQRHLEIRIPLPPDKKWADDKSVAFRNYLGGVAKAKEDFTTAMKGDPFQYIGSVYSNCDPANDEVGDASDPNEGTPGNSPVEN